MDKSTASRALWIRRAVWAMPLVLAGCLAPPDLPDRSMAVAGETPQLLPITAILAQTAAGPHTARLTDTAPDTRAAALRARAAGLRKAVLQEETRARMQASGPDLR